MIAEPKSEKTLARIASALETSFVFKGIEQSLLQQVSSRTLRCQADKKNCTQMFALHNMSTLWHDFPLACCHVTWLDYHRTHKNMLTCSTASKTH